MKPAQAVIAKVETWVAKLNGCWVVTLFVDKYTRRGFLAGHFLTRKEARQFAKELKAHWKYLTELHSPKE